MEQHVFNHYIAKKETPLPFWNKTWGLNWKPREGCGDKHAPVPSSKLITAPLTDKGSPTTKTKRNKQFSLQKKRKLATMMWGTAASRRLPSEGRGWGHQQKFQAKFLFAWRRKSQGQLCIHMGRRTTHLAWFSLNPPSAEEPTGLGALPQPLPWPAETSRDSPWRNPSWRGTERECYCCVAAHEGWQMWTGTCPDPTAFGTAALRVDEMAHGSQQATSKRGVFHQTLKIKNETQAVWMFPF